MPKDYSSALQALRLGKTHTPIPLEKYNDNVPNETEFQVRTFEMIENDNVRYNEDGRPKSKMKSTITANIYHCSGEMVLFSTQRPVCLFIYPLVLDYVF